ncbi:uncharacterized protein FMAN_01790 [Fusarium mangiferae]|uniref:NAD-dependent epimerase/dehydratase domain-containing protein n=1 Tax=Fusarium mangiferae TaxID=192010 RepID=A0A1L7SM14_FUSMA|nr:uncharacterized protein FMAN_01790 [Fusarium mangiferae]CVK84864.1 uncharacterized protein FMAN_01790 [Fusarium mangiferae]
MGKIAVAGGSSGLGRTTVDALNAAKTHDYVVLSRKATGPETRAVDYSDIDALTSLLESEQVDTVISMLPIDNDESGQAQMNLIEAAEKSTSTKRFLPSEFGMVYKRDDTRRRKHSCRHHPLYRRSKNYTVALLDIPNWKRRYAIVANRMTLNEAVKLAEEVKGVKFDVKYFSVEQMKSDENDLTPSMKKAVPQEMHGGMKTMLTLSGIGMATGSNDIQGIDDLVVEFPGIKPVTVRDVWEAWK